MTLGNSERSGTEIPPLHQIVRTDLCTLRTNRSVGGLFFPGPAYGGVLARRCPARADVS